MHIFIFYQMYEKAGIAVFSGCISNYRWLVRTCLCRQAGTHQGSQPWSVSSPATTRTKCDNLKYALFSNKQK
jgi:hypothetical protein